MAWLGVCRGYSFGTPPTYDQLTCLTAKSGRSVLIDWILPAGVWQIGRDSAARNRIALRLCLLVSIWWLAWFPERALASLRPSVV